MGQSLLVAKEDLSELLERVHGAPNPAAHLAALKERSPGKSRKKLRVLVRKDQAVATLDSLPDNLRLERGRFSVSFQTSEELAAALYWVGQILEQELDEFERRYQKIHEPNGSISPENSTFRDYLKSSTISNTSEVEGTDVCH